MTGKGTGKATAAPTGVPPGAVLSHTVSPKQYAVIFAALLLLTFVTTEVARIDLGRFNVVAALTIALVKAVLVVLFFMHVKYTHRLIWLAAGAGLLWLSILLGLTVTDYFSRSWLPSPRGW